MAKFTPLLGHLSGSVAGNVFSHNRNGPYIRGRSIPVNPQTDRQNLVRGFFGAAASAWSATLTEAHRSAWDRYAQNTPLTDNTGSVFFMSGINAYMRGSIFQRNAEVPLATNGPTVLGEAASIAAEANGIRVTDSASGSPNSVVLTYFNISGFDPGTDNTAIRASISIIQNIGVQFFNGPWVQLGFGIGNTAVPITTTALPTGIVLAVGDIVFVQLRWVDHLGRVSPFFQARETVINLP